MARIYMASSWRNVRLDRVAKVLREAGHEVYDFRTANPPTNFNWSMVCPGADWDNPIMTAKEQQASLRHPIARSAFGNDRDGLHWADTGVLVLPCGKSAHLEAGYLLAQGKPVHILLSDEERPELMHLVAGAGNVHATLEEVVVGLARRERPIVAAVCPDPYPGPECLCPTERHAIAPLDNLGEQA